MRPPRLHVLGGHLGGQAAMLVVVPLLTRFFGPGELGPFQVATAMGLMLQPVATLRLELIVPATGNAAGVARYVRLARMAQAGVVAAVLAAGLAALALGAQSWAETLVMAALITLAYAWIAVDNAVLIRHDRMTALAWRNLGSGVFTAVLQLFSAMVLHHVVALAASVLVGRALAIALTAGPSGSVRPRTASSPAKMGTGLDTVELVYTSRRAAYGITSGLVAMAGNQWLTIYAGAAFGPVSAGYVGTAQRVAGVPLATTGQALLQLVQSTLAPAVRDHRPGLVAQVRRQALGLGAAAAAATVALVIGGPLLAGPLLGPEWVGAGTVIALLAAPLSLQLVMVPVTPLFAMLGRERLLAAIQLFRLAASLAGAAAMHALFGAFHHTVAGFAAGTVAGYLVTFVVTYRVLLAREAALVSSGSSVSR